MGAKDGGFENPKEGLILREPQQARLPRDHKGEDILISQPDTGQRAVLDPLEKASQLHDLAVASRE